MSKTVNWIGKRFRWLVVLSRGRRAHWLCRCDCGVEREFHHSNLKSGHTKSCGCRTIELKTAIWLRHGHNRKRGPTPTYRSWASMRQRCETKTAKSYADYGGAGIRVCERWKTFDNFLADMGKRPPGTSIDRYPNNAGNYEPGNCRWATSKQQTRNRRNTRTLTVRGETLCVTDWAIKAGMSRSVLARRLKSGWPPERAVQP